MRDKDFENFIKTGNIKDYLKYKEKQSNNGEKYESNGGNSCKDNKLSR
jgi:hypothetical protein